MKNSYGCDNPHRISNAMNLVWDAINDTWLNVTSSRILKGLTSNYLA